MMYAVIILPAPSGGVAAGYMLTLLSECSAAACCQVTPSDVEDGSVVLSKYMSESSIAELVQADSQGVGKKGKAQTTRVSVHVRCGFGIFVALCICYRLYECLFVVQI